MFKRTLIAGAVLTVLGGISAPAAFAADAQSTSARLDQLSQEIQQLKREATAADNATIKYRFSASLVANYTSSNQTLMGNAKNTFMGGAFMPVFIARYKDLAEFEAHMEFTNNGTDTESSLEYAQADLFLNDRMTLVAGKFLSPFGQFQQAIHPPWVNKLPDRPAGFEEGGAEPTSDVGVQLRGAWPLGNTGSVNYAVFMTNGPHLTPDDGLSLEGASMDTNDNKAFGGRLGIRPKGDLNLGVSFMQAKVAGTDAMGMATGSDAGYSAVGADFSYTPRRVDLRGELINSQLDSIEFAGSTVPKAKWNLWYVQAGYRFGRLEPVVRVSQYDQKDGALQLPGDDNRENRTTVGLDYWFGPTIVAKVAYENRNFKDPARKDAKVVRLQLAYGF